MMLGSVAGLSGKAAKMAGRPSALTPGPAQRDDTPAAASEHTANFLPLAFAFFEEALGSKFPHAAFHQVCSMCKAAELDLTRWAAKQPRIRFA